MKFLCTKGYLWLFFSEFEELSETILKHSVFSPSCFPPLFSDDYILVVSVGNPVFISISKCKPELPVSTTFLKHLMLFWKKLN